MKNLILTLLLLCLSAPAFAGEEKESAYDRVIRTGTIKCGYGISPPVLVKDPNSGVVSGLDYDIWQEIGKELGLKIEFAEEAGWGNFIEGLKTGRYDAFCSELWPDPGRVKFLSLTQPVLYSFLNTYVRTDDHRFDGDLEKINTPEIIIPAIEGDVSVAMAQSRFPSAKILALPQANTVSDMFMAVLSKKADVIFVDQAMFLSLDENNKGALRKLEGVPASFVFASYFGVNSGEIQLRDMINVAIRTMIDDGRMERLARKYSQDYIIPAKNY
jgi:ABC-type amino acid transport substrate-binding protein